MVLHKSFKEFKNFEIIWEIRIKEFLHHFLII